MAFEGLSEKLQNAFKKHLPNSSICAVSEEKGDDRDFNARIVVSTYPTMLNLIGVNPAEKM